MTRIVIGSEKGGYLLTGDSGGWSVDGPLFPGWKVTAFGRDSGMYLAAVASNWFGVGIHRSEDLINWEPIDRPPAWPEDSDRKMEQLWRGLLGVGAPSYRQRSWGVIGTRAEGIGLLRLAP